MSLADQRYFLEIFHHLLSHVLKRAECYAVIRKPLNTTLLMDTIKILFQQNDKDNQSW